MTKSAHWLVYMVVRFAWVSVHCENMEHAQNLLCVGCPYSNKQLLLVNVTYGLTDLTTCHKQGLGGPLGAYSIHSIMKA